MPFADPTIGHLNRLEPATQAAAVTLVTVVRNAGVPLYISSSARTLRQQKVFLDAGVSMTLDSKHLRGEAFDIDVLGFGRDQIPLWWFTQLGQLAEHLGLRWGGRWTGFRDYGHFEIARSSR